MTLAVGDHPLSPLRFSDPEGGEPVDRVWYQVPRLGELVVLREGDRTVIGRVKDIEWSEPDNLIHVRLR